MAKPSDEKIVKYEPFSTPKGVHDILPEDHDYFTFIKKVVRHRARQAGFRRITTPIFEFTDVFKRTLGMESDIVSKEMYEFLDKKGRSLTLKPEGTAGVVRSYIEHGMHHWPQPVMLYYVEPHFRYDRPQKGRYRQFWQYGLEILGENDPALDAQLVQIANRIHKDLGIEKPLKLKINTIGTAEARKKYMQVLEDFFVDKERAVPEEFRGLIYKNPMRLLDKKDKDEDIGILAKMAPKMEDYLDKESREYHEEFKSYLDELGLEYEEDGTLVRGLDYYSKTVFEFVDTSDSAQNAVCAGGRYDGLAELMGGQHTPAVGLASGIERLIANMKREKVRVPSKDDLHVFVAQLGKEAKLKCLPLMEKLHEAGVKAIGAVGKGSINIQLKMADKFKVPYTILMGVTEVREGTVIIRNMKKGTQEKFKYENAVEEMVKLIGEKNLDHYSPGEVA